MPPETRSQVVEVIDELSESSPLQVALLIDASASMKPKLRAVEEAIRDMMLSLGARKGESRLAVFHFPGAHSGEDAVLDVDWTGDWDGAVDFPASRHAGSDANRSGHLEGDGFHAI
ncbi:hypothetical protein HMSSN036_61270 [Paenibacillus macerans]|nr:hypothetical protein HMSSN036_61270 [Paenibacillus macerans]